MTPDAFAALFFHLCILSARDNVDAPQIEKSISCHDSQKHESTQEVLELLEKLKIGDNSNKK